MATYQKHWGVTFSPFCCRSGTEGFYESPIHEEALARLEFLVEEQRRLGLLLGPAGSGKSLVLSVFASRMRNQGRAATHLSLMGVAVEEFPEMLAGGLGLNLSRRESAIAAWRRIEDRLAEFRYQQTPVVMLLDDADVARPEVLTQVARLAKLDPRHDSRLTIILAGQPSRIGRMPAALLDLAELRIDLGAWEPADTARFIEKALANAGRSGPIFGESALLCLHELARGIPRRVSQLADLALVVGAGRRLDSIDAETVESACTELGAIEVVADR